MPAVNASGTSVSYTAAGSGPGLVFVAGTGLPEELVKLCRAFLLG